MKVEKHLANLELVPENAEDIELSAKILYFFGCHNGLRPTVNKRGFAIECVPEHGQSLPLNSPDPKEIEYGC